MQYCFWVSEILWNKGNKSCFSDCVKRLYESVCILYISFFAPKSFFLTVQKSFYSLSKSHIPPYWTSFLNYSFQHKLFYTYWISFFSVRTTDLRHAPHSEFIFGHKTHGMMMSWKKNRRTIFSSDHGQNNIPSLQNRNVEQSLLL